MGDCLGFGAEGLHFVKLGLDVRVGWSEQVVVDHGIHSVARVMCVDDGRDYGVIVPVPGVEYHAVPSGQSLGVGGCPGAACT